MLYNISLHSRKTSVKSKKNHFFIVSSIEYFYPVLIQKNDTGETQKEINEIQELDRQGNRQEKSRMGCTIRPIKN